MCGLCKIWLWGFLLLKYVMMIFIPPGKGLGMERGNHKSMCLSTALYPSTTFGCLCVLYVRTDSEELVCKVVNAILNLMLFESVTFYCLEVICSIPCSLVL